MEFEGPKRKLLEDTRGIAEEIQLEVSKLLTRFPKGPVHNKLLEMQAWLEDLPQEIENYLHYNTLDDYRTQKTLEEGKFEQANAVHGRLRGKMESFSQGMQYIAEAFVSARQNAKKEDELAFLPLGRNLKALGDRLDDAGFVLYVGVSDTAYLPQEGDEHEVPSPTGYFTNIRMKGQANSR